ncbi:wax ester synthase-like acyl-CoA acyltransferase domain-containing protein [Hyaloraphidium curvatum]|nr:wax ester synthase-like acyl-CoA acyltransferase domain-containing protein [Hyaloraphidium curvatum]
MSVPKTAAEPVRAPTLLDRLSSIVDGTDLSKVQYLTALDNSFLVGEDEGHSTAVAGLYIFRKRIPPEVVLKTVGDYAVSGSSRMMSRVVLNKWMFGRPYYQRGADFDARNHFEIVQVPAPGGKAELELVAGQLQGRFLDFEYPPWKAFYLDGVDGGNGCAIYWMSHHCLADGQGFVRTLLGYVMSVDENGNPRKDKVDLKSMQYAAGRFAKLEGGKEKPPATPIRDLVAALVRAWIGIALFVVQSFLLLFVFRKRSLVQPEFKVLPQKQLAYSNKIMMEDLKAAKNHYQCTINDLMVTASSGAVQKYLEHKQVLRDRELVYMIPTSVRRADDFSISNTTSAWLFPVTATKEDPVERLSSVAWRFNLYKQSWEPWVYYWTSPYTLPLTFPWMLPKPDPRIVAQLNTLTGVITNVPGPSKPIYWAGVPFDQYVPVLCPGANIIGTALQSLNDHITLGVTLDFDPDASPQGLFARDDARLIVSLFESEVSRLFQSAKKGQPRRKSVIEVLIPEDARDAVLRKQDDIVVPGEDGAADGDGGFETVETSGTKRIAEGVPVEGVKLPGLRSTDSILVAAAAQAVSA